MRKKRFYEMPEIKVFELDIENSMLITASEYEIEVTDEGDEWA